MINQSSRDQFRLKFWDVLSGAVSGVIGALILNMVFPETQGVYLLIIFILPGLLIGAIIGLGLGRKFGRGITSIISASASFLVVLIALLILLKNVED
jgi:hypothetical protein